MTVFVVQQSPGKNLIPAQKFGQIEILLPPSQIFVAKETLTMLREKLKKITENDFLVMIGDPVAIAMAAIVASEYCALITFLKWDKQEKQYVPVVTDLDEGVENGSNRS